MQSRGLVGVGLGVGGVRAGGVDSVGGRQQVQLVGVEGEPPWRAFGPH